MIDRARPVHAQALEGMALSMADGHQGLISEMLEDGKGVGQVESPVERVDRRRAGEPSERKGEMAHVAVDDIEVARALEHPGQFEDLEREVIPWLTVEPQGAGGGRHELRFGARVAAREEGDVVPPGHQLLGHIADDALRAPVERRGHPLVERRDLGDPEPPTHDAAAREESGPSSARVRITGVSIGQSSSASAGMLTRRASTGPLTSVKPSVTTRLPALPRATAGGLSWITRSTHHVSCSSAYLIAQRPMVSPVVRVAVVVMEARLVLAGDLGVQLVRRSFLDSLLGQVDHEGLLSRGDRAQPRRGEQHLAASQPAAGVHYHVADLEVGVAEQDVAHVADLAVGGEDGVVEHVLDASKHYLGLLSWALAARSSLPSASMRMRRSSACSSSVARMPSSMRRVVGSSSPTKRIISA